MSISVSPSMVRESGVRSPMAATLRDWIGDDDESDETTEQNPAPETTVGEETYFRDGTVDSLEALLPRPARRTRSLWSWMARALVFIGENRKSPAHVCPGGLS